jgi:hypothetical protein
VKRPGRTGRLRQQAMQDYRGLCMTCWKVGDPSPRRSAAMADRRVVASTEWLSHRVRPPRSLASGYSREGKGRVLWVVRNGKRESVMGRDH